MVELRVPGADVPERGGLALEGQGKRLAIFRHAGSFYALDDTCPHRGGPLHEGEVEGGVVACPWHQWRFCLDTGASPVNPLSRVNTYPTRVEGEDVFVEIG